MGETKDQALPIHTRNNYKKKDKKENHHHNKKKDTKKNKIKSDPSNFLFYTCDEKGHFAREFPINKKGHHAHVAKDDEPINKIFRIEKNDSD